MMAPPLVFRLKTIYASFEMPSPSTLCPVSCSQLLVCPSPLSLTTCPRADQSSLLIFVYMVDAHLVVFKRTPPARTSGGSTWVIVSSVPCPEGKTRWWSSRSYNTHVIKAHPPLPLRSRSGLLPPVLTSVKLRKLRQQPLSYHPAHFYRKYLLDFLWGSPLVLGYRLKPRCIWSPPLLLLTYFLTLHAALTFASSGFELIYPPYLG